MKCCALDTWCCFECCCLTDLRFDAVVKGEDILGKTSTFAVRRVDMQPSEAVGLVGWQGSLATDWNWSVYWNGQKVLATGWNWSFY